MTPDSISWKIHSEVVLLLGWGRALLLQIAHPLVAQGVAAHGTFLIEPRGRIRRLYRTLDAMLTLTFGAEEEKERVIRHINALHDRVNGVLLQAAGGFSAGTPYSAHDPELLCWVHATLLDSFLLCYEFYVGPLSLHEKDRYCAEAAAIEPLLGIPNGYLPRSAAELEEYMADMLASGKISVSGTAREIAQEIVAPSAPRLMRPLFSVMRLPTIGLLPSQTRESYHFRWDRGRERVLRLSARLIRCLLPIVPPVLRLWPQARSAMRRARQGRLPGKSATDRHKTKDLFHY